MHVLLMGFPPFQDPTDLEAQESIEEDLIPLHSPQYAHIPYPAAYTLYNSSDLYTDEEIGGFVTCGKAATSMDEEV